MQQGFTYLEAIIAILVITIGIVAILQIFPLASVVEMSNRLETQATFLCQEKMETINSMAYQDITIGTETEDPLAAPFEKFSRETTVIYVDSDLEQSAGDTGLKKITIRTWWQSLLKVEEKEVQIITLIAER